MKSLFRIIQSFNIFFLISFSSFSQVDTTFQNVPVSAQSTPEIVLVKFQVLKEDGGAFLAGIKVQMLNRDSNKLYISYADKNAACRFLVPPGNNYIIGVENVSDYFDYKVSYKPGIVYTKIIRFTPTEVKETIVNDTITQELKKNAMPTSSRVKLLVKIVNFENKSLTGEKVYIDRLGSKQVYMGTTNSDGFCIFLLPSGFQYTVSFEIEKEVQILDYRKIRSYHVTNYTYNYIGTKEYYKRKKERDRLLRERDSLFRVEDSLYRIELGRRPDYGHRNFLSQLGSNKKSVILKRIEERAIKEQKELLNDSTYYEKARREVNAVLYRMRNKWKNKVIVTDITGSMYPYMDQILVWHIMKFAGAGQRNRYVFFNDGDSKADSEKNIGRTGGIHFTEVLGIDGLFDLMVETMEAGGGGDGPENDLEALLWAKNKRKGNAELILVADNYSSVKDIELLKKLTVPVRIVVCGAKNKIHEDYLEIAWKTKGSVHTVESDIFNLSNAQEGKVIKVGGEEYYFSRGKFYVKE